MLTSMKISIVVKLVNMRNIILTLLKESKDKIQFYIDLKRF